MASCMSCITPKEKEGYMCVFLLLKGKEIQTVVEPIDLVRLYCLRGLNMR